MDKHELEDIIARHKIGRADYHDLREAIDAALAQREAEVWEACADFVESLWDGCSPGYIAKRIRARKETP